jgi:hypothetical protein
MRVPSGAEICPVCGYALGFPAWEDDSASDEICPSCGIQFGYDDVPAGGGLEGTREEIYTFWREQWMANGMPWTSKGRRPPSGWDPVVQVQRIGGDP